MPRHQSGQLPTLGHSVKGAAGNLGAEELARAAADLEALFNSGDLESSAAAVEEFRHQADEVFGAIEGMVAEEESITAETGEAPDRPMDLDAVRGLLLEISGLLETDISGAMDRLEPLGEQLAGTEAAEAFTRLAGHLDDFETELAAEVLDEIAGLLSIALPDAG